MLADAETRPRDLQRGQRLAIATDHRQRLHGAAAVATLSEAEATLTRLQERQSNTDAARAAVLELSASTNAEAMQNRLAAAGCGAPLRPDAASVLQRLKARAA